MRRKAMADLIAGLEEVARTLKQAAPPGTDIFFDAVTHPWHLRLLDEYISLCD